jgi:hypothetical protein
MSSITIINKEVIQLNGSNEAFELSDRIFLREFDGLQYKRQTCTSGSERTSMAYCRCPT